MMNKLWDKIKGIGREIWLFLSSFLFLRNLLGMLGLVAGMLFLTIWGLRCYTNHGESLQVHDYIGMQLEEAVKIANARSFRTIVSDSVFIPEERPNMVIEQNPSPLSRVKEKRTIYLTVTKKVADLVELPPFNDYGYDYNSYSKNLSRIGVKSKIKERVFDNKQAENSIMHIFINGEKRTDLDLRKGINVPMGSTVEFVITERGGTFIEIPDLTCRTLSEAEFVISGMQLNIGSIREDATINDRANAYVWRQSPTTGSIRIGEQIDLYITQGLPSACR